MDHKEYITSGIIESYCLGLLTPEENTALENTVQLQPELKQDIEAFMHTLEKYALDHAVEPDQDVKNKTLNFLENLRIEEATDIQELPLLNKYSDHNNWLRIVKGLLPEKLEGDMFVHQLRNDSKVSQTLIWTAVDYPEEVHTDEEESFIILKGRCRCYIEDTMVELGPGGFLEIPMYKHHDVKVLEHPVLAVVQRVKVA